MEELKELARELRESAEVCDRIAAKIQSKVLRYFESGYASGYRAAARKLEVIIKRKGGS